MLVESVWLFRPPGNNADSYTSKNSFSKLRIKCSCRHQPPTHPCHSLHHPANILLAHSFVPILHSVQDLRESFVRDMDPDAPGFPTTLGDLTEQLKSWRGRLQVRREYVGHDVCRGGGECTLYTHLRGWCTYMRIAIARREMGEKMCMPALVSSACILSLSADLCFTCLCMSDTSVSPAPIPLRSCPPPSSTHSHTWRRECLTCCG